MGLSFSPRGGLFTVPELPLWYSIAPIREKKDYRAGGYCPGISPMIIAEKNMP
jgi:hypothetical protein